MYAAPRTLAEALTLMGRGDRTPLAGGTDVYPMRAGRPIESALVDLTRVTEMRGIESGSAGLRIGALTTWSDVAAADLGPGCGGLQGAALQVGGPQIQNVGTIGGNLCNASPAADGVPPLLTLNAIVELASESGIRSLPLQEFLKGYRATALRADELLAAVVIPETSTRGRSSFLKLGSRRYLVISIAAVAVRLELDPTGLIERVAIAVGACSPVAQRLSELESEVIGLTPMDAAATVDRRHLAALEPIDDPRASAGYRILAAQTLVARGLRECGDMS